MHPVFNNWKAALLYLAGWIPLGAILGLLISVAGALTALETAAIIVPVSVVLVFVCLSPWYACRALPLRSAGAGRLLGQHLLAAAVVSGTVLFVARIVASSLSDVRPGLDRRFGAAVPVLGAMVAMIYLLSIAMHYVVIEARTSRRSELLAREAQLRALKAQVNPHFLFNSLNSISALTASDAVRARQMCIQLADFLRTSLRLGERASIPFSEEMELTQMYLSVEQIRFGQRLRLSLDVEPACCDCEVPALLIQPLVENAVKHGIALLDEGGEILMLGRRVKEGLRFTIENPYDPMAPASRSGIGLANVRQRLEARYGSAARLDVEASHDVYRVSLLLPGETIMRAIIADDEELARRVLREYLAQEARIEVVAECANGLEAVKAVAEHKPDVLFLDIQMPKLDGFEVLELIDRQVAVVFVTAFDQYAMRAFDAAAVDYLLKPFSQDRFRTALQKVKQRPGETRPASQAAELKNAARLPGEYLERIVVKDGSKVHVIPAGKLDYAEAQDDYVALRSEGRTWLKQQTIASLENVLHPKRFVRIHRGYLVNIERITRIEPNTKDTWIAVLQDGTQIPVSRGGYARFNSLISG